MQAWMDGWIEGWMNRKMERAMMDRGMVGWIKTDKRDRKPDKCHSTISWT